MSFCREVTRLAPGENLIWKQSVSILRRLNLQLVWTFAHRQGLLRNGGC
jgi:hypothetical protein